MTTTPARSFTSSARDPWCPGCGHTLVIRALQRVLSARFDTHDVVLVTDIGCIGMADGLFRCHTVHGLHGRSPALAAGIAMTLPRPDMKVVVLLGDGGAAIGLQHILECARLNVDLCMVVCNNQNYGMTGGQQSAYTLPGVRTTTSPGGAVGTAYDLCKLLESFGVPRARVLANQRDSLTEQLDAAVAHEGFAFVEVLEWCPSYAGKLNPETITPAELERVFTAQGQSPGVWPATSTRPVFHFEPKPRPRLPQSIPTTGAHTLEGEVHLLLAGSAGKGVQSAAEIFARAAIAAGLHVALRSEYPVTVGRGFSASHLVLADHPIESPVSSSWDLALVCSSEGLAYVREHRGDIRRLVADRGLAHGHSEQDLYPVDPTGVGALPHRISRMWLATPTQHGWGSVAPGAPEPDPPPPTLVELADFDRADPKGAAFAALVWSLRQHGWFDRELLATEVQRVANPKQRESLQRALDAWALDTETA